jgi:hypothetical protein
MNSVFHSPRSVSRRTAQEAREKEEGQPRTNRLALVRNPGWTSRAKFRFSHFALRTPGKALW